MQLVRICGPTAEMRLLGEVKGLDFERTSARRLDDDTWQVAGYATDEALAEIEARGLTTKLVVSADKLAEDRSILFTRIAAVQAREAEQDAEAPRAGSDEPGAGT